MNNAQYAELFLTESREHVSAINHSLLALERGTGGDEPVDAIFRGVHTIKGMSATMGYTSVAALSHELDAWQTQTRRPINVQLFAGGHFYLQDVLPQLLAAVARDLA